MSHEIYRYHFGETVPTADVKDSLLLAAFSAEGKEHPSRIRAGIAHCVAERLDQGDCWVDYEDLVELANALLAMDVPDSRERIEQGLDSLIEEKELVCASLGGRFLVAQPKIHKMECDLARIFTTRRGPNHHFDDQSDRAILRGFPELNASQRRALLATARHNLGLAVEQIPAAMQEQLLDAGLATEKRSVECSAGKLVEGDDRSAFRSPEAVVYAYFCGAEGKRILLQFEPAYLEAGWGGQAVCDGSLFPQVLILGDSHAASAIGQTLQQELLAAGLRTARQAIVGSGIGRWFDEALVAGPDTFPVILLGTNDFARPPDEITAGAIKLMQRFDRPGVWLGPPLMTRADVAGQLSKLDQALQQATGRTGWVLVPLAGPERPGSDGVHFSGAAARTIGERAARAVLVVVGEDR